MSILIKDVDMPTSCNACELAALVDISDGLAYGCRALKEMIYNDRERLPDCPLIEIPCNYDELLKAARAMHTWIFLHSGNEELAYKACGLSDEMNAFLGYSGPYAVTIPAGKEDRS